ncbi:LysR substrate-binding domain-containing protein [Comamonas sp.]
MQPDLHELLIFARVVQDGSFTRAAQSLRLPKTTVSRKVQELEARLGFPLMHRTTRKSTLTEAGSVLYEHAQRVAAELKEAQSAMEQLSHGPQGHLRVSAPHSFAIAWITPLLAEFYALYPHVRIELLLGHEPLDVLSKEIDVALRLGNLPSSGLVARRLATFRMQIYASPTYVQRYGAPQHPDELIQHRALVLPLARQDQRYVWKLRRHEHPGSALEAFAVHPILEASDPEALYAPMLSGMGLMQIMSINMQRYVAAGQAVPVLSDWIGPEPAFSAVFPRGHGRSPKVRAFLDFLIERLHFGEQAQVPRAFNSPQNAGLVAP